VNPLAKPKSVSCNNCSVQIPTKSPADSEMMSPGDTR
jgi:hypothetical protein